MIATSVDGEGNTCCCRGWQHMGVDAVHNSLKRAACELAAAAAGAAAGKFIVPCAMFRCWYVGWCHAVRHGLRGLMGNLQEDKVLLNVAIPPALLSQPKLSAQVALNDLLLT